MKNTYTAVALVIATLLLAGCGEAQNMGNKHSPGLRETRDGIKYRLVKIEGRTFVATQTYNGNWTFAGPID
jgi:hypothetical protein